MYFWESAGMEHRRAAPDTESLLGHNSQAMHDVWSGKAGSAYALYFVKSEFHILGSSPIPIQLY